MSVKWLLGAGAVLVAAAVVSISMPDPEGVQPSPAISGADTQATLDAGAKEELPPPAASPSGARTTAASTPVPGTLGPVALEAGWIVRGRVAVPQGADPGQTEVEVRPMGSWNWLGKPSVTARAGADGRYEAQVREIFEYRPGMKPDELLIAAQHPDCVPVEARVVLRTEQKEPRDPAQGAWVFEADLELRRAGIVTGTLRLPGGEPAEGARVLLLPWTRNEVVAQPMDRTTTDAEGRFRLRGAQGSWLVLGLHDGYPPASTRVEISLGSTIESPAVSFPPAAPLSGRVTALGSPAPVNTWVRAQRALDGRRIRVDQTELLWTGEALVSAGAVVRTSKGGVYSIDGLERGTYEVSLAGIPEGRHHRPHLASELSTRTYQAPTTSADLEVEAALIRVRTITIEGPVTASVSWKAKLPSYWTSLPSTVVGPDSAPALVPPATPLEIRVEKAGYAPVALELVSPGPRELLERTVELVRSATGLEIELVTSDGRPIHEAGFGIFATEVSHRSRGFSLGHRDERSLDGIFRLTDLEPGRFVVGVEAGGTWEFGTGYWCAEPLEVELAAGEVLHRTVRLRPGGRIRIECQDANGRALAAECRVLGPDGSDVPVVFEALQEGSGSSRTTGQLVAGLGFSANDVRPNLLPGNYELRFTLRGYQDAVRRVTVKAEETTHLLVVLEPR